MLRVIKDVEEIRGQEAKRKVKTKRDLPR